RDNSYKARIKILVKAEGARFVQEVEQEWREIVEIDGGPHTLTQAEYDRVAAFFQPPAIGDNGVQVESSHAPDSPEYARWLQRNVAAHKDTELRAVTLSLKRIGYAPGDATPEQMEHAAELADTFSGGEIRVTHAQNLLLPWVRSDQLPQLWQAAKAAGFARPTIGLLTDMIACPGGDFCALANARSIPLAEALLERYQDLDELFDLGEIDLHISGCINSCGHHHSGHIGILGVDKDGKEWYQVSLGGSDGSALATTATPGKVIGPSFAADEVADVLEAVIDTYRAQRTPSERFIDTIKRVGLDPFKAAANATRRSTAQVAHGTTP
ncbi:MAG: nitrite/sulfite reductase, partial [Burkholderiales bacterium]